MKIPFEGKIQMDKVWVNYMKEGEFNPPHVHIGDLSCVLYLQIPKDMNKNKNYVATSEAPGSIQFIYGENLKNNFIKVILDIFFKISVPILLFNRLEDKNYY